MICFNQMLVIFRPACCRSLIIQKIEAYIRPNYFRMYRISVTADRGSQSHYRYNNR